MTFCRKKVESFVLIRDGCAMVLDGVNRLLEETEPKQTQPHYDIMKLVTRQTDGKSGYYLKASAADNQNNHNFEALIEDLKQHGSKLTKQGYFCWLFSDNKTVGMKPSRK